MPQQAPAHAGHPGKNSAKPLPRKAREKEAPGKQGRKQSEDAAVPEWRELAEFQFLDG